MFAIKLTEKIPNLCNAKERCQSFMGKKNIKSVKKSKLITLQLKPFENTNIVNIKLVIIELPKTSHKSSKL